MGGRSSSFRSRKNSGGAMPSVPTLHGSKDQIAQAEKIRKPYADALKNLDEDTIYKGIRVNRGETSEQAMKNDIAPWYYETNNSVAKDLTRIRQNHGDTDDRRHELVENVRSGKITLEQAKTTAQRVRKQTQKAINAFYRSEGKKLMSHQDASWWISHKKELK